MRDPEKGAKTVKTVDQLAVSVLYFLFKGALFSYNYFFQGKINFSGFNKTTAKLQTELWFKCDWYSQKISHTAGSEQRVWELSEVQLTGSPRSGCLDVGLFCQVGNMFRVKFMAEKIEERDNKTTFLPESKYDF